jgi:hypothetical protein
VLQETLLAVYRKDGARRPARASTVCRPSAGGLRTEPAGDFRLPEDTASPWLVPRNRTQAPLLAACAALSGSLRDWVEPPSRPSAPVCMESNHHDHPGGFALHRRVPGRRAACIHLPRGNAASFLLHPGEGRPVFVMPYLGAVEGRGQFPVPKHVYRMTAEQAAYSDPNGRLSFA